MAEFPRGIDTSCPDLDPPAVEPLASHRSTNGMGELGDLQGWDREDEEPPIEVDRWEIVEAALALFGAWAVVISLVYCGGVAVRHFHLVRHMYGLLAIGRK